MSEPSPNSTLSRRFCVAPMMDWTDRHCRYFLRLLSRRTLLYTEMVTTGALLHGDSARFLAHNAAEYPLALQLGGSNPEQLAACARLAEQAGYSEVNLNVGCPSDRVQNNMIGACLMAEPDLVGRCIAAMREAVTIPVTVKCRIGIDALDSYEYLLSFIDTVHRLGGCESFIIHARIALLQGLSPKQNREVPPLKYERVYRLKQENPQLEIIINGGIRSLEESQQHLQHCDGVMLGREAYQNPWLLQGVDAGLFGQRPPVQSRHEVMERFYPYVEEQLRAGVPLQHMSRHILGLFQGQRGGKRFRRYLSERAHRKDAGLDILQGAVAEVSQFPPLEEAS